MDTNTARTQIENGALSSPRSADVLRGILRHVVSLQPINMDNEEHVELLREFVGECPELGEFLESFLSARDLGDPRVFVTELLRSDNKTVGAVSLEFCEGDITLRFFCCNSWTNSERKEALSMLAAHLEDLALKQEWKRIFLKEPSRSGAAALRQILGRQLPNGTTVEECN